MGEVDEPISGALEHAAESRLNSIVAVLVALAATLMALDNIKDGNVTQAMSQAQARSVDAWSYYQAKSTKQNLAEATLDQLQTMRATAAAGATGREEIDKKIAAYQAVIARYDKEKADIKAEAEGYQHEYDRLNLHDDQFDLSDAGFSVSIALLGVTALTRKRWLLGVAAVFLAIGVTFGLAGFFNWQLHPDKLMAWLRGQGLTTDFGNEHITTGPTRMDRHGRRRLGGPAILQWRSSGSCICRARLQEICADRLAS